MARTLWTMYHIYCNAPVSTCHVIIRLLFVGMVTEHMYGTNAVFTIVPRLDQAWWMLTMCMGAYSRIDKNRVGAYVRIHVTNDST